MMYPGGGFGGTAQRIIREETPETESALPLKQALIGALASDALVLLLVGAALCAGPLAPFPLAALAIGLSWRPLAARFGRGGAVGASVGMFIAATWVSAAGRDLILPGLRALWTFARWAAGPMLSAPWWAWFLASALAVLSYAFPKGWRRRAAWAVLVAGVLWWSANGWGRTFRALSSPGRDVGVAAQALAVPLLVAASPFALALAARNWIEVLVGSTWPPQYNKADISVDGILGLVAPWLTRRFRNVGPPASPRETVEITLLRPDAEPGIPIRQTTRFPRPPHNPGGLSQFAQAIGMELATFSQKGSRRGRAKGAIHFGYTQEGWYELREAFVSAHLADRMSDGSARVNEDGKRFLEVMASRITPPLRAGEADVPPE